ncbi:MAG: protein kinase [Clostridia bacterium]|nr:protein kinase [Clostridia bacterium]
MTRNDLYKLLIRCKRPHEFFGAVADEDALKKLYFSFAKLLHPDTASSDEKYISEEAIKRLNELYDMGRKELLDGIYSVSSVTARYSSMSPLFSLNIRSKEYHFYEYIFDGEVADVYRGVCNGQVVCLKHAKLSEDDALLEAEYDTLMQIAHVLLPVMREKLTINGTTALIMDEVEGVMLTEIIEQYPSGIPVEHIPWILERLFSVVGYLHFNKIVHGNLTSENVMLNKANHKVSTVGFSFHIPNADSPDSRYKTRNPRYCAPEISKIARVTPAADIYSIGRIAIELLGGDLDTNTLPSSIDPRLRLFIGKLTEPNVSKRPYDAWRLWDELIALRQQVFGPKRFIPLI